MFNTDSRYAVYYHIPLNVKSFCLNETQQLTP